jgi:hypothetical protein
LTEKYKIFVNIRYPWISAGTVGTEIGINILPWRGSGMGNILGGWGAGKLPPLIPHLVDIPNQFYDHRQKLGLLEKKAAVRVILKYSDIF